MIKTIFRNTFLVGLSVLILCALLFFGLQYTQTTDEARETLRQEARYAEQGLSMGGVSYLEALEPVNRVTWIDAQGEVLFDSENSAPADNQQQYAEVRGAMDTGEGHEIRNSEISGESTMFYALKCADGTVLRLSRPISAVRNALTAVSPVMWVLVLVLLISGTLAFRAAKQIVDPINNLDLEHPDQLTYPELAPLIGKIQEQRLTILEEESQKEQMRREFSANVSHELKTPLTSISGFAELMAEGVVTGDKVQEFSRDIYKESQRMISLIDDIIKLSRLDEEAVDPAWEQVDLYALAEETLDALRPAANQQGISLRLTGEHAEVSGIDQLLHEMVYNLCDNAIKYNRMGGNVEVSVRGGETPSITISDTGIGIPEKDQARVFERFYRVDKSHSKEIGGTGLGLSIVKHGAQFHGAEVLLESEPGVGTSITLKFSGKNKA